MKTKKFLANLMLMSIAAAATVSFTACSDDVIENQNSTADVIKTNGNAQLLSAIGLVYTDFITENDVTILNADTTEICVNKAYADKMGITNFVDHPMGIWDKKENAAYLRRATEQRLVGDRYILKVKRSNIAEVIGSRDITLNTKIYYNPGAAATRAAATGMPEEAAKYVDENNVIHPAAITINSLPGEDFDTRGAMTDYGTWTVEEIMNGEMDAATRWNPFKWIAEKVEEAYDYVKEKSAYTIDADKQTYSIIRHQSKLKKNMKFECGPSANDTIRVNFECPIKFDLDYTLEIHARGDISTVWIPRLNYLETYFDGYFGVNPKLQIGFSKEVSLPKDKQRINLCKVGGIGVTFMIGIIPVHIDFDPSIYLKFTAALEGKAYIQFNYDFATKFRAGVKYNGRWSGISNGEIVKSDFTFDKPAAELEAKAGVGLMFGVDVIIDKIAGPTIAMGPQLTAKANLVLAPWAEEKVSFKANVKAGCMGEVGAKIKVFGYELADWEWPFEIGPQKTIFEYPKAGK